MKYYDIQRNQLLFFYRDLKEDYWDNHWEVYWDKLKDQIYKFNRKSLICKITNMFLKPKDGPILEGGCGLGQNVFNLNNLNYDCIGIDYAENTIKKIKELMPELKIKFANIKKIPFRDNEFAGYWSLGVIEHFFNGYNDILEEMKRVLKPKGFLFISFPYMSPLRVLKSKVNLYKIFNNDFYKKFKNPIHFYQFALNKDQVIKDIEGFGFKLRYYKISSGVKGFKDEIFVFKFFFKKFLQILYDNEKSKIVYLIREILDKFLI